jgi:hypothetical protein
MRTVRAEQASNENRAKGSIVSLRPSGNGVNFYRALARVLVRRELIFAGVIPAQDGCDDVRATG